MSRMLRLTENPWSAILYMSLKRKEISFEAVLSSNQGLPTFEDRYIRLTDPITALDYIEDRHPEPRIFPVDPALKASMRYLIRYLERHDPGQCLRWIEAEIGGTVYDPTVQPTALDFYIAAFAETHTQSFFSAWEPLKITYLFGARQCVEFTLKSPEIAGVPGSTDPEKQLSVPILPLKRLR